MEEMDQIQHSRQKYLPAVDEYVNRELLPGLGHRGKVTVEPATSGKRSHVYFLQGEGFDPAVLRGEVDRVQLKRRIRGHQLLLQRGFDVPEIVYQDLRPAVRRKYGFYFILESKIHGCFFAAAEDTVAAGAKLGALLAKMHQVTSWGHGWPGEFRWPGNVMAGTKLRYQTRKIVSVYRRRYGRSADDIIRWLKQRPPRAWFAKPRLTTGGFISSNVMMEGEKVVIIDLARVRYANAARDLAQVRFSLIRHDARSRAAFFESYRRSASKTLLAELAATQQLLDVFFLIRMAVKEKNLKQQKKREREVLNYCELDAPWGLREAD